MGLRIQMRTIAVTQRDITDGIKCMSSCCPVALAIIRATAMPDDYIKVSNMGVFIDGNHLA